MFTGSFPPDYNDAVSFVKELSAALLLSNPELDEAKARENLECVLEAVADVHPFSMNITFGVYLMYQAGLKIVGIVSGPEYGELTEITTHCMNNNTSSVVKILNYNK